MVEIIRVLWVENPLLRQQMVGFMYHIYNPCKQNYQQFHQEFRGPELMKMLAEFLNTPKKKNNDALLSKMFIRFSQIDDLFSVPVLLVTGTQNKAVRACAIASGSDSAIASGSDSAIASSAASATATASASASTSITVTSTAADISKGGLKRTRAASVPTGNTNTPPKRILRPQRKCQLKKILNFNFLFNSICFNSLCVLMNTTSFSCMVPMNS